MAKLIYNVLIEYYNCKGKKHIWHVEIFYYHGVMLKAFHSYHIATRTHIHNNTLTDQYNGFVTLKDFELPDDGFD